LDYWNNYSWYGRSLINVANIHNRLLDNSGQVAINIGIFMEIPEKEVQDTSCRGSGISPSFDKSPKIGGLGG